MARIPTYVEFELRKYFRNGILTVSSRVPYVASGGRRVVNDDLEGFGRRRVWPHRRTISEFVWRGRGKPQWGLPVIRPSFGPATSKMQGQHYTNLCRHARGLYNTKNISIWRSWQIHNIAWHQSHWTCVDRLVFITRDNLLRVSAIYIKTTFYTEHRTWNKLEKSGGFCLLNLKILLGVVNMNISVLVMTAKCMSEVGMSWRSRSLLSNTTYFLYSLTSQETQQR